MKSGFDTVGAAKLNLQKKKKNQTEGQKENRCSAAVSSIHSCFKLLQVSGNNS